MRILKVSLLYQQEEVSQYTAVAMPGTTELYCCSTQHSNYVQAARP